MRVAGEPADRGRQYGRAARDLIARTIASYETLFGGLGLSWREACDAADRFVGPIRRSVPAVLDEIEGIAQGAGLRPEDVLVVNCRTELFRLARRASHECTAVAALPEATAAGTTLLAQTWDWHPPFRDVVLLLVKEVSPDLRFACLVEAGMVAKNGLNSAGIGLATNSLLTTDDPDFGGLPHHAVIARILESRSIAEALAGILGTARGAGANYLLASATGEAVNVETGPGIRMAYPTLPRAGMLAHANDFVGQPALANPSCVSLGSRGRLHRVEALLGQAHGQISVEGLRNVLSNHAGTDSVCRHPASRPMAEPGSLPQIVTIASLIIDVTNARLVVGSGPACTASWHEYELGGRLVPAEPSIDSPAAGGAVSRGVRPPRAGGAPGGPSRP